MSDTNVETTEVETKSGTEAEDRGSLLGTGTVEETKPEGTEVKEPPETEAPPLALTDIKVPEGFQADETQFKEFTTALTDPQLGAQERAQKLVDMHVKALKDAVEGPGKAWDDLTNKWVGEVASDKEIGSGDPKSPLKPEVKAALSKIIDQVGGTELRQALDFTGAGNNPYVIRAFFKLGQKLVEGGTVSGSPAGKPAGTGAAALYPDLPER